MQVTLQLDGFETVHVSKSSFLGFTVFKLCYQNKKTGETDPSLERVVRERIRKENGDILVSDISSIDYLFADNRRIQNLEGIQLLTNLKSLYIEDNEIVNIEPYLN